MQTEASSTGQAPAQPPKAQYAVEGIFGRREFTIAMDLLSYLAGRCGGKYEPMKITGSHRTGFLVELM